MKLQEKTSQNAANAFSSQNWRDIIKEKWQVSLKLAEFKTPLKVLPSCLAPFMSF